MHPAEDFIIEKIERFHKVMLGKQEAPALANQIFQKIKPDEIYEESQFYEFIKRTIGDINPKMIQESIQLLVDQKRLIQVSKTGKIYFRKLELLSK